MCLIGHVFNSLDNHECSKQGLQPRRTASIVSTPEYTTYKTRRKPSWFYHNSNLPSSAWYFRLFFHASLANTSQETKLHEVSLAKVSTLEIDMMSMRLLQRKDRRLKRRSAQVTCICRPQTTGLGYRSGWFALTCNRTSIHDPQCPQSSYQDAVTNLQLRATLCSLILRTKISLSFALSYGAGLSVTQNLQCQRVVPWSSPAFAFMESLVTS
jgi:hypothetical protein